MEYHRGHMDVGESFEETAIRETFEETGLTLHTLELLKVVSGKNALVQHRDGSQTYYVTAIFGSKDFSGELRGSDEGQELDFFDLESLPAPLSVSAVGAAEHLVAKKSCLEISKVAIQVFPGRKILKNDHTVTSLEALEDLYGQPSKRAELKVSD